MSKLKDLKTVNDNVDNLVYKIRECLKNILVIQVGSLPGRLSFGSNLNSFLFDLIDLDINGISREIRRAIERWEPRVNVRDVNVVPQPEYNRVFIEILYLYRDENGNIQDDNFELLKNV